MADFLLELLSEEIPARMQEKAAADLVRLFDAEIARAGLAATAIESFVGPRRLALIARGLPAETVATSEEVKGPRADAPAQAITGFLGKIGLTRDQLVERADAKGNAVLFAVRETPGRATAAVLADAVPAIVRAFPWPKSMRWGAASASPESLRWVRPLQRIVALLDDMVVPIEIAGVASGRETAGHRFMGAGDVAIPHAAAYAETLRAARVIVDAGERRRIVREGAGAAARVAGLVLVEDEGLVAENAGLTEWPVPLLGRFDPAYLDVPREVIQLTMRTNQKYFSCVDADGALAPAFVCTANIEAADGGAAIVAGNGRVLAARLADARFFWEQDLRVPLDERAKKLSGIVFHEKLGTVADKVERVAKLARWLVEEGIVGGGRSSSAVAPRHPGESRDPGLQASRTAALDPSVRWGDDGKARLADLAERAARLCKADLVTGMVGEFPELQGVIGGYLAAAQGEDTQVADAIRDHYKPVGQGDEVPTAPVTVAVSLADKLDTLVAFFTVEMPPSGSRDPFALRRACISAIQVIVTNSLRFRLGSACRDLRDIFWHQREQAELARDRNRSDLAAAVINAAGGSIEQLSVREGLELATIVHPDIEILDSKSPEKVVDFFADRLKVQQREAGVRHDLIDAVFALGGEDDLVRLLARVKALQAFLGSEDGANLLAGYRRAANILRKEGVDPLGDPAPVRHPELDSGSIGGAADGARMDADLRQHDGGGWSGFRYDPEPAERALADALDAGLPAAETAVAEERFENAMASLAGLRAPIDRFFDDVTVNADDPERRTTRLALLARLVAAMHKVADFSKIEG